MSISTSSYIEPISVVHNPACSVSLSYIPDIALKTKACPYVATLLGTLTNLAGFVDIITATMNIPIVLARVPKAIRACLLMSPLYSRYRAVNINVNSTNPVNTELNI